MQTVAGEQGVALQQLFRYKSYFSFKFQPSLTFILQCQEPQAWPF